MEISGRPRRAGLTLLFIAASTSLYAVVAAWISEILPCALFRGGQLSENPDCKEAKTDQSVQINGLVRSPDALSTMFESPYAALLKNMREAEYLQLLDLTPLFVTVLGPRRQRLYINKVGLDYLGTTTNRWRDTLPSAELHPEDVEPVQHYWNQAFATGLPFECEFRCRRQDGTYRWLLGRVNKVLDENDEIRRWHLAVSDIDDRKRTEELLRQEKPSICVEIGLESGRLKRVLDHIAENFRDHISLEKLAEIAGYSPFHFARKFTLTVGIPPQRYVARMRLENAMLELAHGKLPLAEVAFNAHFSSQASFTRAFQRFAGTTPKQYRRNGFKK